MRARARDVSASSLAAERKPSSCDDSVLAAALGLSGSSAARYGRAVLGSCGYGPSWLYHEPACVGRRTEGARMRPHSTCSQHLLVCNLARLGRSAASCFGQAADVSSLLGSKLTTTGSGAAAGGTLCLLDTLLGRRVAAAAQMGAFSPLPGRGIAASCTQQPRPGGLLPLPPRRAAPSARRRCQWPPGSRRPAAGACRRRQREGFAGRLAGRPLAAWGLAGSAAALAGRPAKRGLLPPRRAGLHASAAAAPLCAGVRELTSPSPVPCSAHQGA